MACVAEVGRHVLQRTSSYTGRRYSCMTTAPKKFGIRFVLRSIPSNSLLLPWPGWPRQLGSSATWVPTGSTLNIHPGNLLACLLSIPLEFLASITPWTRGYAWLGFGDECRSTAVQECESYEGFLHSQAVLPLATELTETSPTFFFFLATTRCTA